MSNHNVIQQWKHETMSQNNSSVSGGGGVSSNGGTAKTPVSGNSVRFFGGRTSATISEMNSVVPTASTSLSCSISSGGNLGSSSITSIPNQFAEINQQDLHHSTQQQSDLDRQIVATNKIANLGFNLAKITGLEGIQHIPEEERLRKVQQIVEAGIGDHAKQQILQILDKVSLLKPPERLLLYLRMPSGTPETDPLRQPQNPLGTRSEINHTINWVRSHLEHDPKVSIPKQDVYNDYVVYCERVDIKPLSTADFGKVMKQVFPEIRPRRLGTRGHSRYCYAAMRKATKLESPKLPYIGRKNANSFVEFNDTMDEDSWKIIKMWAEGLLNGNFNSLKDLATHITKHHLNSPASNSSRLLIQKKLLQKEAKEKRKFMTDNSPIKKRRKKKRKSSSSSESTTSGIRNEQNLLLSEIKQEIIDTNGGEQCQLPGRNSQHPQQMLPINLATDQHDSNNMRKITQGTNLACDTSSVIHNNMTATTTGTTSDISAEKQAKYLMKAHMSTIKEEIEDDYPSANILCKKVRQAHAAKGLWNPVTGSNHLATNNPSITESAVNLMTIGAQEPYQTPVGLMGPPAQMDLQVDHNMSGVTGLKRTTGLNIESGKNNSPNLPIRAKKLKYIQAKIQAMQNERTGSDLAASTAGENNSEKDVLPENLGIPRERVISICNMDKHELDDYLIGEDNSQDQEAELLQYFQPEDANDTGKLNYSSAANSGSTSSTAANTNAGFYPMMESYYQQFGGTNFGKNESRRMIANTTTSTSVTGNSSHHNQEEINQLRYYLHQNFQNNNNNGSNKKISEGNNLSRSPMEIGPHSAYGGLYAGGSASASLAMMSQRHLSVGQDDSGNLRCQTQLNTNNKNSLDPVINLPGGNSNGKGPRRKINLNARQTAIPNSPNTRRKHFSFVPISTAASNNNNNAVEFSPFVSPRSTPVVRKPPLHKQQSLPLSDHYSLTDPMLGSAPNSSYNKSLNLQNNVSASAPPSPSFVQQRFKFVPGAIGPFSSAGVGGGGGGGGGTGGGGNVGPNIYGIPTGCGRNKEPPSYDNFQSDPVQFRTQIGSNNSVDGYAESMRSQSVPLHSRNSPAFNQIGGFQAFSSTCSSMAQTPVPAEFADFTDPVIFDILNDSSQIDDNDQDIKLETNDLSVALLDSEISSSEPGFADLLAQELSASKMGGNFFNSISRSVPSTPLPLNSNVGINGGYNNQRMNLNPHFGCVENLGKLSNSMYDMSKSVPTTPVAMSVASFRYSPEFNRDYLINGNTVESTTPTYFINQAQQIGGGSNDGSGSSNNSGGGGNCGSILQFHQPPSNCTTQTQLAQQSLSVTSVSIGGISSNDSVADKDIATSLSDDIDELSNFGDVTESIIGSDILNSL